MSKDDRAFSFLRINQRESKPRRQGLTEIRGSYYTMIGKTQLKELLELLGDYVDNFKYVAGSGRLSPRRAGKELNALCHQYNVEVSAGGGFEFVITRGPEAVEQYLAECKELGFDIIEISTG